MPREWRSDQRGLQIEVSRRRYGHCCPAVYTADAHCPTRDEVEAVMMQHSDLRPIFAVLSREEQEQARNTELWLEKTIEPSPYRSIPQAIADGIRSLTGR